jgi:membrane protein
MESADQPIPFKWKDLPSLIKETHFEWAKSKPWRLSAIIAYYAIFSIPAIVIIILNLVNYVWGEGIVSGLFTNEITNALGVDVSKTITAIITNMAEEKKGIVSTIIGVIVIIYGATGIFYHLHLSLNEIWQIKLYHFPNIRRIVFDRVKSFLFVLLIGFLILLSLIITTIISTFYDVVDNYFYLYKSTVFVIDFCVSVVYLTFVFGVIFRYLPDAIIKWSTVWLGAFITSTLFVIGKFLLGLYFAEVNPTSAYGVASTIIFILLWVSYSCVILFFGAQFTWVFSKRYGIGIQPKSNAFLEKPNNNKTNFKIQTSNIK